MFLGSNSIDVSGNNYDELFKLLDMDKFTDNVNVFGNQNKNSEYKSSPFKPLYPIQPRPPNLSGETILSPKRQNNLSNLKRSPPPSPKTTPVAAKRVIPKRNKPKNKSKLGLLPPGTIVSNLEQFKMEFRNRLLARQVRLGKLPASYFELNPYYNSTNSAQQAYWNYNNRALDGNIGGMPSFGDAIIKNNGKEELWLLNRDPTDNNLFRDEAEECSQYFGTIMDTIGNVVQNNIDGFYQPTTISNIIDDPFGDSIYSFY